MWTNAQRGSKHVHSGRFNMIEVRERGLRDRTIRREGKSLRKKDALNASKNEFAVTRIFRPSPKSFGLVI